MSVNVSTLQYHLFYLFHCSLGLVGMKFRINHMTLHHFAEFFKGIFLARPYGREMVLGTQTTPPPTWTFIFIVNKFKNIQLAF